MNITQVFTDLMQMPVATATVASLLLAIISLWFPRNLRLPAIFFSIYLILGLLCENVQFIALPFIVALALSYYVAQTEHYNKALRIVVGLIAFVLSLGFFIHIIPGFVNIKVIDQVRFTANSTPFTMYLNLDKPLVGFFILLFGAALIKEAKEWKKMLIVAAPIALLGFIVILAVAYLCHYIAFAPKFTSLFFIWAISNLFLTAVAEEALCRGFILKYFDAFFIKFRYGQYVSLIIVSLFFGILHLHGGWCYVLLATIAGLFYGRIYQKTGRIEASILTHFCLNTLHFLLFTYPALSS